MKIDQQPDEVQRGPILRAAIVIALGIVGSLGAVVVLTGPTLGEVVRGSGQPPPQIETTHFNLATEAELARRAADFQLSSYGWVDRDRGVIRVPLAVAIDLYLAEHP